MAIDRNAGSLGNFVNQPGEYRVKVTETKTGMSKSQKPMLTVTFQTHSELSIRGYFVKTLTFHMKALEALKVACGMKVTEPADNLVGKECGILVEAQEPDANGKVFMTISGYGPAAQVTCEPSQPGGFAPSDASDNIPF